MADSKAHLESMLLIDTNFFKPAPHVPKKILITSELPPPKKILEEPELNRLFPRAKL